jgi:hypothetical protein
LLSLAASIAFLEFGGPAQLAQTLASPAPLRAHLFTEVVRSLLSGVQLAVLIAAPLLGHCCCSSRCFTRLVTRATRSGLWLSIVAPLRALSVLAIVALLLDRLVEGLALRGCTRCWAAEAHRTLTRGRRPPRGVDHRHAIAERRLLSEGDAFVLDGNSQLAIRSVPPTCSASLTPKVTPAPHPSDSPSVRCSRCRLPISVMSDVPPRVRKLSLTTTSPRQARSTLPATAHAGSSSDPMPSA